MAKITLKDIGGIEFEMDVSQIAEVHRIGGKVTIIDRDGIHTMLNETMEGLLNKLLKAKFGEV